MPVAWDSIPSRAARSPPPRLSLSNRENTRAYFDLGLSVDCPPGRELMESQLAKWKRPCYLDTARRADLTRMFRNSTISEKAMAK